MKKLILPEESGLRHRMQDLEYIQQGVLMFQASSVMQHLPSDFSGIVILEGCQITKTGSGSPYTYNLSAGRVFYKPATAPTTLVDVDPLGEILEVGAQTIVSATEPQWELHKIAERTGLRVFRSGQQYDVCLEFKMRLKTGSGLAQWNEVRRLEHIQYNKSKELYSVAELLMKLPSPSFLTDFFDGDGLGLPYKKYEGFALMNGLATVGGYTSPDMGGIALVGSNHQNSAITDVRDSGDYLTSSLATLYGKFKKFIGLDEIPDHAHAPSEDATGYLESELSGAGDKLQTGPGNGATFYPYTGGIIGYTEQALFDLRQPIRNCMMIQKIAEITYQ